MKKTVGVFTAILLSAGTCLAQDCLHGKGETDAERQRLNAVVGLARQVNTAQYTYLNKNGRFGQLDEIADYVAQSYPSSPKVLAGGKIVAPAGFDVRLQVESKHYTLKAKDTLDPCGLAVMTDEEAMILLAYPMGSRAWRDTPKSPAGHTAPSAAQKR